MVEKLINLYLPSLLSLFSSNGKRPNNLLFEILKEYHKLNVRGFVQNMITNQRTVKHLDALKDKFAKAEKFNVGHKSEYIRNA